MEAPTHTTIDTLKCHRIITSDKLYNSDLVLYNRIATFLINSDVITDYFFYIKKVLITIKRIRDFTHGIHIPTVLESHILIDTYNMEVVNTILYTGCAIHTLKLIDEKQGGFILQYDPNTALDTIRIIWIRPT